MSYTVRAEWDNTGWWVITVPDVPGAISQCKRLEQVRQDAAEVIEIQTGDEVDRWLTGQEKGDGHLEFGGWIWRYDLAPLGPSETEVTLTYDWSAVPRFIREYLQFPPFGPEHLTNSLHHLAELAAHTAPGHSTTPD